MAGAVGREGVACWTGDQPLRFHRSVEPNPPIVAAPPPSPVDPSRAARKVSQCNKNAAGAEAFGAFTSVVKTLARRCPEQAVEALGQVFLTGTMPVAATSR